MRIRDPRWNGMFIPDPGSDVFPQHWHCVDRNFVKYFFFSFLARMTPIRMNFRNRNPESVKCIWSCNNHCMDRLGFALGCIKNVSYSAFWRGWPRSKWTFGIGTPSQLKSFYQIRQQSLHGHACTASIEFFYYIFVFQLFGEDDPDQNVSPDTEDPEAAGDQAGEVAAQREANGVSALYGVEKVISVWCLLKGSSFTHDKLYTSIITQCS